MDLLSKATFGTFTLLPVWDNFIPEKYKKTSMFRKKKFLASLKTILKFVDWLWSYDMFNCKKLNRGHPIVEKKVVIVKELYFNV